MSKLLEKAQKNIRRGKLASAHKLLKKALADEPENPEALYHLGALLRTKGSLDEAIGYLTQAVSHSHANPCWYVDYAAALQTKGAISGADKAYRIAEITGCDTVKFFSLYADFLTTVIKDYSKAEIYWAKVINLHPELISPYISLSNVYISLERYDEAIQVLEHCINMGGTDAGIYTNLGKALSAQGRRDEAMACYEKAIELEPSNMMAVSSRIMELLYSSDNQEFLYNEIRKMVEPINKNSVLTFKGEVDCKSDRKLRIGFVSADFYHHAIAYYISPILANLSKEKISIYLYYNNSINDNATKLIKDYSDYWCDCLHLSDDELAKQIRSDKIDILIDLSNHSFGNRLTVFAKKPAPLQISWMGIPVSTGLDCIDYKFYDKELISSCRLAECSSENIIPLPRNQFFEQLAKMPQISEPPCLRNGYITFGSFNGLRKISKTMFQKWAEIVHRVPQSKIIIVIDDHNNLDMQNYIIDIFANQGVIHSRVNLQGKLSMDEYLRSHNEVDIALDPYPYNGQTTTYNALLMGVPVISCSGKSIASNFSLSLLSMLNKQDWVARNLNEYVEKAVLLSNDSNYLSTIRQTMRDEVAHSNIMDHKGLAKNIQDSLASVWNAYCSSNKDKIKP